MQIDSITDKLAQVLALLESGESVDFLREWEKLPSADKTAIAEFILFSDELGVQPIPQLPELMHAYLSIHSPLSIHIRAY